MKASEMKNTGKLVKLLDGNHKMTVDYNTFCQLEEFFGSMEAGFSKLNANITKTDIKKFLCAGINSCIEDEDEWFTPFQIGKLLDISKMDSYVKTLMELINLASPKTEETDEKENEETKN